MAALGTVTGFWAFQGSLEAPFWAAMDGGYFAKYGLSVDLSLVRGSQPATAAMASGQGDVVEMGGQPLIQGRGAGVDMVLVAGYSQVFPYHLMANPSIKTLQDLEGKTVAITILGGADQLMLGKTLAQNGVDPSTVNMVATSDTPAKVAALQTGQVDAAMLSDPDWVATQKSGAVTLYDFDAQHIPYENNGLITSQGYVQSHRPELLAFIEATTDGIRRMQADPSFTQALLMKYAGLQDADQLQAGVQANQDLNDLKPYPSPAAIQEIMNEMSITDHAPGDYMDSSLVKELDDSGFFNGS